MSKESMMSGYTRGPWGFGNTARYERMILGDGGKGRYVCHVTVEQSRGGIIAQSMEAEREANARLIAAAPTLLEALREMRTEVRALVNTLALATDRTTRHLYDLDSLAKAAEPRMERVTKLANAAISAATGQASTQDAAA